MEAENSVLLAEKGWATIAELADPAWALKGLTLTGCCCPGGR